MAMNSIFPIVKILTISAMAFVVAIFATPILTHFLYKYRLGKKIRNEGTTPIYTSLHKKKEGTPTMGGILIWLTVTALAVGILFLTKWLGPDTVFSDFNFLTRKQTLLPLGILLFAAIIGLIDDLLGIFHFGRKGGGLRLREKLIVFTIIAIIGAYWFYFKLDWDLIHIPFVGDFNIGWWYIPIFISIIVATAFSTNQTDGLDGLAGGVLLTAFSSYAVISYAQGRIELATFCGAIVGALLAFLWFNINPARFFMGDTGSMSLGVTLGVIAMLTNSLFFLPFIGFILVIEFLTTAIQLISKKFRHKKVFLSAPIHHHFEAKGWPETKVTMRFWIISGVMAVIGLILFFVDKHLF
ncbi:MAG: phospho-N-acetylmuramoyl-pentapeptide-transferase [Candidatus Portnoybacteria bacterium CG10_big_fil_rev_8_21_14_0_10_38_18]|uniref:Phospho-N-acetylmuramoyl-pentapeptide-transferase n=1 Tax=Candidatus Portnoybacteria bacterium CG10_big_fil_rev_8_21_14_0_10_38_18 TaxID=1974813 RepID=A0A2M8KCP0_9BACT|nr:MAG: phospho-N-acetylmuramoyl-pentapeptide-transferase [Candidatus Portnoybacteria bacterium CG10_big_fil_rev_8_21_14_0_10_38_18]